MQQIELNMRSVENERQKKPKLNVFNEYEIFYQSNARLFLAKKIRSILQNTRTKLVLF